jgi:4-amino-4-deoxy-L-arabinose transferase-like glycosyltransferase
VSDFRLMDRRPTQRPHIQSPAELKAYIAGRIASREKYNEQEADRLAAERLAWRRSGARRQRVLFGLLCVVVLGAVVGSVYLMHTEGRLVSGLCTTAVLMGAALWYADREGRE